MKLNFDVIVIGSGPAGMTASIYLKRANMNVAMIDGNAPGGQINKTALIENYPGYGKITGPELAYNMYMQTQELSIPFVYGKVINVIDKGNYKIVKLEKEEILCKSVIIATGRKARELGLNNEKELTGRGISWCAICDGSLFKDKEVAVVGGGNSALEESLYLSNIASKVYIIHRSNTFRGDMIFQEKVFSNPKIEVSFNTVIDKLNVKDKLLDSIDLKSNLTSEIKNLKISGLFIYIGFEPSIDFASSLNLNNSDGYIIVDNKMRTNVNGIYACGDIIKKDLYQITTATAEGSIAAMSVINDLK
jgi:thioredoxin reductase (NADPH)